MDCGSAQFVIKPWLWSNLKPVSEIISAAYMYVLFERKAEIYTLNNTSSTYFHIFYISVTGNDLLMYLIYFLKQHQDIKTFPSHNQARPCFQRHVKSSKHKSQNQCQGPQSSCIWKTPWVVQWDCHSKPWNLKTFYFPGSIGNCFTTNHSWDWWKEGPSKGDSRWYIIMCSLSWGQTV